MSQLPSGFTFLTAVLRRVKNDKRMQSPPSASNPKDHPPLRLSSVRAEEARRCPWDLVYTIFNAGIWLAVGAPSWRGSFGPHTDHIHYSLAPVWRRARVNESDMEVEMRANTSKRHAGPGVLVVPYWVCIWLLTPTRNSLQMFHEIWWDAALSLTFLLWTSTQRCFQMAKCKPLCHHVTRIPFILHTLDFSSAGQWTSPTVELRQRGNAFIIHLTHSHNHRPLDR